MSGSVSVLANRPWAVPYNNFSYEERCRATPMQSAAFRNGVLRRPNHCTICDLSGPPYAHGRYQFVAHLERYDHPYEIYPVCRSCHGILHGRFADLLRWQRLLRDCGGNGRWFDQLSVDPAAQYRPLAETYPDGLPPPPYSLLEPDLFAAKMQICVSKVS